MRGPTIFQWSPPSVDLEKPPSAAALRCLGDVGSIANPSTVPPGWFCSQLDADEVHGALAAAAEFLSGEQWDPALIREAIDRLSEEERLRGEVAQIAQKPDEQTQLDSVGRPEGGGTRTQRSPSQQPRRSPSAHSDPPCQERDVSQREPEHRGGIGPAPSRRPAQVCSRGRPVGSEGSRWARPR